MADTDMNTVWGTPESRAARAAASQRTEDPNAGTAAEDRMKTQVLQNTARQMLARESATISGRPAGSPLRDSDFAFSRPVTGQ